MMISCEYLLQNLPFVHRQTLHLAEVLEVFLQTTSLPSPPNPLGDNHQPKIKGSLLSFFRQFLPQTFILGIEFGGMSHETESSTHWHSQYMSR